MTICKDVREGMATGEAPGPETREHLAACPRCREVAEGVEAARSWAAAAAPTAEPETGFVTRMAAGAWERVEGRRRRARAWVAAAGLLAATAAVGLAARLVLEPQPRPTAATLAPTAPTAPRPGTPGPAGIPPQPARSKSATEPPSPRTAPVTDRELLHLADWRESLAIHADWDGATKPLEAYAQLAAEGDMP